MVLRRGNRRRTCIELWKVDVRVAIIGSFKQHYQTVRIALTTFREAGIEVTTPKGSDIQEEGIAFVRFHSDPPDWDDPTVQTVALHRILRADAVYVVAPNGYVGRTTCYEIGRVLQAHHPIYFSEAPDDLPIAIPASHIVDPAQLARLVRTGSASSPFATDGSPYSVLERRLVTGDYSDD
jgi:hypothetical protein